jgi:hypothetical protein
MTMITGVPVKSYIGSCFETFVGFVAKNAKNCFFKVTLTQKPQNV